MDSNDVTLSQPVACRPVIQRGDHDLSDAQLLRYSRHVLLDELGIEGQQRISAARVLVLGAGGLGCSAAAYLASAGVGTLTLVDHDTVDLTNLQRQILHTTDRVGMPKVESAKLTLQALNPLVQLHTHQIRATPQDLSRFVSEHDVVLDCTDNFSTRHALNAACVEHCKVLVSGAAVRFDGQVAVFDLRQPATEHGCYACLFPDVQGAANVDEACATMGVFAPLVGIIGSMQAAQALQMITGVGQPLVNQLMMLDARTMQTQTMRFVRDHQCTVCGTVHG